MEILDYLFEKSKPPVDEGDYPAETSIFQDYDALVAMLTYSTWKGEPRQVSTVTVGYTAPTFYARLNDYENRRSLSGEGKSVSLAIESLNQSLLLGEKARWYNWPANPTKSGGRPSTSSNGSGTRPKSRGKSK